jgi:hypothetical protein
MCCVLVPQTKKQTATRVHLTPLALYGPIWISGTKMWVHGRCCHGKKMAKLLEGRAVAAHVGCCVFAFLYFVLCLSGLLIFDVLHFGALYGPIGISSAKMWVHGRCCHGKKWQSCWRVGQWRLMFVVVCVCVFFLCIVLCLSGLF